MDHRAFGLGWGGLYTMIQLLIVLRFGLRDSDACDEGVSSASLSGPGVAATETEAAAVRGTGGSGEFG